MEIIEDECDFDSGDEYCDAESYLDSDDEYTLAEEGEVEESNLAIVLQKIQCTRCTRSKRRC